MTRHERVDFKLQRDDNGFPPSDYERLWATPLPNGNYAIDNIPFFVMGISSEDEVSVRKDGEKLFFKELVKPSGISTFRLIPSDQSMIAKVREDVKSLGGRSEYNQHVGLIAVEIPAEQSIDEFLSYIVDEQEQGRLDFQEGALRHDYE